MFRAQGPSAQELGVNVEQSEVRGCRTAACESWKSQAGKGLGEEQ